MTKNIKVLKRIEKHLKNDNSYDFCDYCWHTTLVDLEHILDELDGLSEETRNKNKSIEVLKKIETHLEKEHLVDKEKDEWVFRYIEDMCPNALQKVLDLLETKGVK